MTGSENGTAVPHAPRWVSTKCAAEHCGLNHDFLRKLRRVGGGPRYVKIGTAVRYDVNELDRWMAERTFSSTADEAAAVRS